MGSKTKNYVSAFAAVWFFVMLVLFIVSWTFEEMGRPLAILGILVTSTGAILFFEGIDG